jgi:hypothetical protein
MVKKSNRQTPRTGFNPKSGAASYGRGQNQSVRPVLTDQARTSRDVTKQVMQTPQPWANPKGGAQVPTGRIDNKKIGDFFERPAPVNAKPQSIGTRVGCAAAAKTSADMMAAVGYSPTATMSSEPIISGNPTRNQQRSIGPGSFPQSTNSGKWNMGRTSRPMQAQETGAVRGDTRGMRQFTDPTGNRYINGVMYTDGVRKGSRSRGASLTQRPAPKKGEAPFYGQR